MPKRTRLDDKLMGIASDIGNGKQVTKLALKLGLTAADADNEDLDCYKILRKAMNKTALKEQTDKLRDGLIKSGHRATADQHLPLRNPGEKKRKTNVTAVIPEKPNGLSELEAKRKDLTFAEANLKNLYTKQREVKQQIKQGVPEVKKLKIVVANLLKKKTTEDAKLLAKERKEMEKLNESLNTKTSQCTSSDTNS